ncbi:MAG: putative DNA-binding domain-containing protein [Rhodobacteraceae bacterium]|nr:putative DNA-binding domain-containing protein [Paracoccaceae bacterium]
MMQKDFAKGLLDPTLPTPEGVVGPNGRAAGKRYDVYRNNVVVSLTEALVSAFPVIQAIVGSEFFDAMAGVHVRKHPPKSPLIIYYGEDFPKFLTKFPPASHLGYLPDVARVELARRHAYHAADAIPCAPEKLANLDGNRLYNARIKLHPSLHIVRSRYPVFSIWRYNSTEDKSPIGEAREITMISRPAEEVVMQNPTAGTAMFIESLVTDPLGVAMDKAKGAQPDFDLAVNLTELLSAGLITDIN